MNLLNIGLKSILSFPLSSNPTQNSVRAKVCNWIQVYMI